MDAGQPMEKPRSREQSERGGVWGVEEGRAAIDEWKRSGQTLADFCRERGVSYGQLYWWKRKLASPASKHAEGVKGAGAFAPVTLVEMAQAPEGTAGKPSEAATTDRGLEVVASNGRRIRIGRDFDPEVLVRLLSALEGLPC